MLEEDINRGFKCINCQKWVSINVYMGTNNRNHCPYCLWSKHVDLQIPGDRSSGCDVGMRPIAVTLKRAGVDKWGNKKPGEIMLVHKCTKCGKISINRVAADDSEKEIINVFENGLNLDGETKDRVENMKIEILLEKDRKDLEDQLFGKNIIQK